MLYIYRKKCIEQISLSKPTLLVGITKIKTKPQSKSDNKFTAKCRLLQSEYHSNILKEPFGVGPTKNSKKKYDNMLFNDETPDPKFISKVALEFTKEKDEHKRRKNTRSSSELNVLDPLLQVNFYSMK